MKTGIRWSDLADLWWPQALRSMKFRKVKVHNSQVTSRTINARIALASSTYCILYNLEGKLVLEIE